MAIEVKRGKRRVEIGVVTRDKMDKTRRVEIPRLVKHPRYGKYIRRRTICYVHDETNQSRIGDTVAIMETRPISKNKNWRLLQDRHQGTRSDDHRCFACRRRSCGQGGETARNEIVILMRGRCV